MQPLETARATEDPVRKIPAAWMFAPHTTRRAKELGFTGDDFYFAGRGGVLGDVDADVVAAAFTFVRPGTVREAWERSRDVLPRTAAAAEFAACRDAWADENIPEDFPAARLAGLLHTVTRAAPTALAPVFAAWRAMPAIGSERARLLSELNLLREWRGARHMAAVLGAGLEPGDAVRHRSPYVMEMFGWPEEIAPGRRRQVETRWDAAEEETQRLTAPVFTALEADQRDELASLLDRLLETTTG